MEISKLSSVYFWPSDISFAPNPYPDVFDLCAAALTFNTEDKDKAVRDFKPYYHKLVGGTYRVNIYDTTGHTFKLLAISPNGVVFGEIDFTTIAATNYHYAVFSVTGWDPKLMFAIYDVDDEKIYGVSDYHSISDTAIHGRSLTLTCSNPGFVYNYLHTSSLVLLRIPAVFSGRTTAEDIETDDTIDTRYLLSSEVKSQRLLKVLPVPAHIHNQIAVALKCSSLVIAGKSWIQEESYRQDQIAEDFEYYYGRVNLTEQGSTIRNVYKA